MTPFGRFVFEATLTTIDSAIYEERKGMAETALHSLKFDSGESLKVKIKFLVTVEEFEVMEEDEAGRAAVGAQGSGDLQFLDESQKVLFEGKWCTNVSSARLVVDSNMVIEFVLHAAYRAAGVDRYDGHAVSGKFVVEEIGLDEAGMGVYRVRGEGTIQQASPNQSLPTQGK